VFGKNYFDRSLVFPGQNEYLAVVTGYDIASPQSVWIVNFLWLATVAAECADGVYPAFEQMLTRGKPIVKWHSLPLHFTMRPREQK